MRKSEYILFENTPAKFFNEAYPIGNGHLGGMVYGDFPRMRLGLNHDELWSGDAVTDFSAWDKRDFEKAREQALKGEYFEATRTLKEKYSKYDGSGYLTLGDLFFEFPDGDISDYRRELNIRDSYAAVSFSLNGAATKVTYFSSYPDGVIAARVESESKISLKLSIDLPLADSYKWREGVLYAYGTCPISSVRAENRASLSPQLQGKRGIDFAAAVSVYSDGITECCERGFSVNGACCLTVIMSADTSYKNGSAHGDGDYLDNLDKAMKKAVEKQYDALLEAHKRDYTELFSKMSLTLGDKDYSHIPTSKRIDSFDYGERGIDCDLITLAFNYGRYLLISGSRKGCVPPNLQGIWNDLMAPPWDCNYTTNINLQMNYWPSLYCGLEELTEPLEMLVNILSERGKACAEVLFGAGGFAAGHNADIFGFCTPVWGEPLWSFFPLSAAWMLRQLYEKYEYTLDKAYLEKIFPLMEGCSEFILDTVVFDGEYYIFSPGTSPENSFFLNGEKCQVARSSTMYGAIIREMLSNLVSADEVLKKDSEIAKRAREILPRLLPPRITKDGRIEEWYFGKDTPCFVEHDPHHRHISHLYDLYPARVITADTPELFAAAAKSLDVRGDDSMGWSLGWKLNCRARLGDSEGVMRLLKLFFRRVESSVRTPNLSFGGGVYSSLLCAPPFQIDGNFAFTSAVCEMLVGERNGDVVPLPALPNAIQSGRVEGLRIRGNKYVNMTFSDGKVTSLEIKEG